MKRTLVTIAAMATLTTVALAGSNDSTAVEPTQPDLGFCEIDDLLDPEVDAALICTDDWCQDRCEARGCLAGVCIPQGACRCYVC